MRRRLIWVFVLLASHLLFFIGGAALGRHNAFTDFIRQTERADAKVMFGHYTVYRDIAVDIGTKRYDRAKCNAELIASSLLDDARACIDKPECKSAVEDDARKVAPEVIGQAPVRFSYIAARGGVRSCE